MTDKRCKHVDSVPVYFGTYGSMLGGCCQCNHQAIEGSDYCYDHSTEEKRQWSQQQYANRYGG